MGEEFIYLFIYLFFYLLVLVSIYLPLSFLQEEERWLSTLRKTPFERPRDK